MTVTNEDKSLQVADKSRKDRCRTYKGEPVSHVYRENIVDSDALRWNRSQGTSCIQGEALI